MICVASCRIAREHVTALGIALLISALFVLLSGSPTCGAETNVILKPYSPFDEPNPPLPAEMVSDKKLDAIVKVFSKNKDIGALVAGLGAVAGVKMTAEPKLRAGTPIVYFRARPLREVMAELSAIYGYTWRAIPDRGGFRYELMQDAGRISLARARLREDKNRADAMLLDFLRKYLASSPEEERIKQLAWTNSSAYLSLFGPNTQATRRLLSSLSEERLARALVEGPPAAIAFSDLPEEAQTAVCDWVNTMRQGGMRWRSEWSPAPTPPVGLAGMASSTIYISGNEVSETGVSRFTITVTPPSGDPVTMQWPSRQLRYADLAAAAGWNQSTPSLQSLDANVEISPRIPKTRLWLTAGDIIEAIGEQSGMDVIADSVQEGQQQPLISGVPMGKLIEQLCREQGYACRADSSTVRFRLARWYAERDVEAPPAALIESCWQELENDGKISLSNLLALSSLSSNQMAWPGFHNLPGTREAFQPPTAAFRLWVALKDSPMPEGGFPVSGLNAGAAEAYRQWIDSLSTDTISREQASGASIVIQMQQGGSPFGQERGGAGIEHPEISIAAAGRTLISYSVRLSQRLSDDDRQALIETRKADRAADVIELVR